METVKINHTPFLRLKGGRMSFVRHGLEKKTNVYGYLRVSSRDQNEDRQRIALQEMEISEKNIYIDKQSGKDFNRPSYKRMVNRMKFHAKHVFLLVQNFVRNVDSIIAN